MVEVVEAREEVAAVREMVEVVRDSVEGGWDGAASVEEGLVAEGWSESSRSRSGEHEGRR